MKMELPAFARTKIAPCWVRTTAQGDTCQFFFPYVFFLKRLYFVHNDVLWYGVVVYGRCRVVTYGPVGAVGGGVVDDDVDVVVDDDVVVDNVAGVVADAVVDDDDDFEADIAALMNPLPFLT